MYYSTLLLFFCSSIAIALEAHVRAESMKHITLTQLIQLTTTVYHRSSTASSSSASLTQNGTGTGLIEPLPSTQLLLELPGLLATTTRTLDGVPPYYTETLTASDNNTYGHSRPTWSSKPGSSSSSNPTTTSAPKVIAMGTLHHITANGAAQTISSVTYSLDECHLYVGTAKENLWHSGTACDSTSTSSFRRRTSSHRTLTVPTVVTLTCSHPGGNAWISGSHHHHVQTYARASSSSSPTQAIVVVGSNETSNGTDHDVILGAPVAGVRSTSTRSSRIPWTTSTTASSDSGASHQETSAATQSSNASAASLERGAVRALIWSILVVGLVAVCCL